MSRVPQLILEVLKSRATRRDSKPYLDMFSRCSDDKRMPSSYQTHINPFKKPSSSSVSQSVSPSPLRTAIPRSLATDAMNTADRTSEVVPSLDRTYTALVKLQGPFTDRQMQSIAEGLVYLQRLGLMCTIVLDHDQWPKPTPSQDPRRDEYFAGNSYDSCLETWRGIEESGLRARMLHELWRVADALAIAGADVQPLTQAVMCVPQRCSHKPLLSLQQPLSSHLAHDKNGAWTLEADTSIDSVYRALQHGHIPIIMPMAIRESMTDKVTMDTTKRTLRCICVDADQVMVTLSREMASQRLADELTPVRLMVITREGGVPSHARGGDPHLMINLSSEYESIRHSYVWDDTHPTALKNLAMIRDCLAYMPNMASGLIATHRSPQSLIANLITNKAAYSPSLPPRLLASRREMRHMPTVVRAGMPIRIVTQWHELDLARVQNVLESSFRRKLNADAYFARLKTHLDFVIVTGNYDGIAIVTREHAMEDPPGMPPIAYLDKFAMLPTLQGSGAVDFLWNALRDEVHGLGLLDALNNNGGHNGVGVGRDLVWKSRAVNKVNRWYFERSNGFMTLPGGPPHWYLFWCDAEDRLKQYAGEPIIAPGSRLDDVWMNTTPTSPMLPIIVPEEQGRWERWAKCLARIPSAWLA